MAWTVAACHRGGPDTTTEPTQPGPIAELDGPSGTLPIVAVPQSAAAEIDLWTFEPGGRRLASTELGACTIWDVETGRLIRTLEDNTKPCDEWLAPVTFSEFLRDDSSADGQLTLDTSAGVAIIDEKTGRKLRDLPCPDCATVDDITWSSEGHELALVWQESARLEIWDADTATQIHAESIPVHGELEALELGWTQAGATVAWTEIGFPVECDPYSYSYEYDCEWDEAQQISTHRPISHHMLAVGPDGPTTIRAIEAAPADAFVLFDPEFNWAFWTHEWSERRAGSTTTLQFEGLGERQSHMGWESFEEYGDYGESLYREGEWRTDGATHWAVAIHHEDYDGGTTMVEWETTLTSPALGRRAGVAIDSLEYDSVVDVSVYGFVGDAARLGGEFCSEACATLHTPTPPDCELIDIASGHGTELLECDVAVLRNAGATTRLPIEPMSWWWSRGGALALFDGAGFMVVDAVLGTGKQPRTDVLAVLDGRLGPELERLALLTNNGLEVIELGAGGVILRVPGVMPDDVAFSPSGDRLAMLHKGQVQVVALPGGEPIASWASDGPELAFRQDGRAIFVGDGQPELVFDASTGKPLTGPGLERITAVLDKGGEIDPSWRWVMNDERGELMRTVDARVLTWTADGAWLADTGQYQGAAPGLELAFRIGTDAWAVPEFDAQQLSKWLERPDLVSAFAAGEPIAKPEMTPAELAGLRARKPTPKG
ncbi:hypothetical protein DB30_08005 [Enhygromyxa salina]|uniref:WD domain, G-beta repeat n=1 Tax=Enhygromyxa salina TaxID=215803 RepID=A0A0C1ZR61_9BACT|nr:hypothetical protein DB30_08005 [Enhygromyxa salina]